MNERATIAAIVILIAAGGVIQVTSPTALASVGTYVAVAGPGDGSVRHVLSLGGDTTATLRTLSPDGAHELGVESGAWLVDGPTVQVVLADPSDPASATFVMFETRDGALVETGRSGARSRFTGLTFTKAIPELPPSDAK